MDYRTTHPWPKSLARRFTKRAECQNPLRGLPPWMQVDEIEKQRARLRDLTDAEMTGLTNTYMETYFINKGDFGTVNNFSTETSLLGTLNLQPVVPANYWLMQGSQLRTLRIEAQGVLSTTSTPTIIFQVRLGTTSGSSYLSGTSIGVSPTITTASGVTNARWRLQLDLVCTVPGIGAGNATLAGAGYVRSNTGFGSPFEYDLEPTTPPTATWTSTFDASVTQYINISATWGTASASNTITCKQLLVTSMG